MRNNRRTPKILAVIPARGNSKGIPRKNLRSLNGKPLIWYSIQTAVKSRWNLSVYVSSDDEEILSIAKKSGAKIIKRPEILAQDSVTLDPVIFDAYKQVEILENSKFDLVVTIQPTSPLLTTLSLDNAIEKFLSSLEIDTLISAKKDTHLSWEFIKGKYYPLYEKRVNRQLLNPTYKETGGFLICKSTVINECSRIGENIDLFVLNGSEAIDIDSYEDWNLCAYYLKRKKLLFVVSGYDEIGLGHVYRALNIANEILDHEIIFLFDKKSSLGKSIVDEKHYPTYIQNTNNIVDDIISLNPDIIINDILDTSEEYIYALKDKGYVTINFEDLGPGSQISDITINSMYNEVNNDKRYFGHEYYILRDEFLLTNAIDIRPQANSVFISFGGTDPSDLTAKVLESIYEYCQIKNIELYVVLGRGYSKQLSSKYKNINIYKKVSFISDIMIKCDLAFTSAGRTTLELAHLNIPSIVLCQNIRELSHNFPKESHGFFNLGLGKDLESISILEAFKACLDFSWRKKSAKKMKSLRLDMGKARVVELIYKTIRNVEK